MAIESNSIVCLLCVYAVDLEFIVIKTNNLL